MALGCDPAVEEKVDEVVGKLDAVDRPVLSGMAVAGDRGVEHVLTILRSEIERGMTLLGVRDIRDLNRSRARAATGRNENEILMVPSSIQ